RAAFALFFVACAWGTTFALIKDVLRSIAPEPFIAFRFLVAAAILSVIAARRRSFRRDLIGPAAILGALLFLAYWGQTRGLLFISPSRSAFLTGLNVVMVPFADRLLRGRRPPLTAWMAAVLAVVGTSWLIGGFNARPSIGDLLTLGCAVASALHVVYTAEFTSRHSATGLAAVQILVVAILALPAASFAARPAFSREVVFVILFTAVVTTALAFVALMWGQARVSATEAAVILAFEPVAASVTSVVFYGEPITSALLIGGGLILAAMVVSQLR
ncbi:MAG TPA: DMT family transporter, partial [Thermoanaerobaculia bacterium]|nr:DMT family transporter [Thermoanaerobaculia bacterium]